MKAGIFGVLLLLSALPTIATQIRNVVEVKTQSGWVRGYEENYDNGQVYRFIKIPFAQPPLGKLRFQKPQPLGEWEDVQGISDELGPSCTQWKFPMPGMDDLQQDENCLYLNIYVPGKVSKDRNLSVMVWIHGGGFLFGGGNQYHPQKLVLGGDVIVVTTNYRLGFLGFLTLNDPLLAGNFGLWDQIEALRWVQNNIVAFGGNPNSVTIFGESAGGMSVSLLTLIPSNKGLFQRAISQSGVATYPGIISKKELEKERSDQLLEKVNCKDKGDISETLKCLQEIPVENITNAFTMAELTPPLNTSVNTASMSPCVDGELIKKNVAYPWSVDDEIYSFFRSIDFMSGTLDGEGNLVYMLLNAEIQEYYEFNVTEKIPLRVLCEISAPVYIEQTVGNVPELAKEICDFYTSTEDVDAQSNKVCEFGGDYLFIVPSNTILSIHAKNNENAKSFQYLITKESPMPFGGDPPAWFKGAGHGDDIHLMFDLPTIHFPEEKRKNLTGVNKLSEDVVKYWTNFAKFGDPNGDSVPRWPSYDVNNKRYVILDTPITTGENLKPEATALLTKIIEKGQQRLVHDEL
ncbi:bile salt-activated lipase-like [Saccostrea echinata]|uniref:bile salt-activated lipase-like n=1 Tax=Saccostrea echinata TaxID=191078 RepID=UPI002A803930|nr:bile salt-activated lipase-like [Saccostrea echinata]